MEFHFVVFQNLFCTFNIVSDYGNMVSVAVPFGLAYALDHGYVREGDTIFLMGTAAGMTVNMLALKL